MTSSTCVHCQSIFQKNQNDSANFNNSDSQNFCCLGCKTAYAIINKLGFANYYNLRQTNNKERKIKPEIEEVIDASEFILDHKDGSYSLSLMLQGLHCAACVWLIESILKKEKNVINARINLSRKTLFLKWSGKPQDSKMLIELVHQIGYKLLPFDEKILDEEEKKYDNTIVKALAVAGFGVGNVMLLSICLWFFGTSEIETSTRSLLQFFSAIIALPVIIYSARPFFSSAIKSFKAGHPNMDMAISIAIFLACSVSLLETFRLGEHVYFDSAVMLIFFLLIGRYLDLKARKKAFNIACEFTLFSASFGRIEDGTKIKLLPIKQLQKDMILLVAAGEKIAADGLVIEGESEVDDSLISGETLPKKIAKNSEVFAGTINLSTPIRVKINKAPAQSLLAQIITLSEEAQNKKNYYVRLADQLAKFYTPAVHLLAFLTFCLWYFYQKVGWEISLMNATAVLIITCPCALALAVPVIQTITISNFIKKGILVKSGEAIEKLPQVDVVIFDKTGSLTLGKPRLLNIFFLSEKEKNLSQSQKNFYLTLAASVAKKSRHPIAQAMLTSHAQAMLTSHAQEILTTSSYDLKDLTVVEQQGFGLESAFENKLLKLGRKEFCEINSEHKNFSSSQLSCFMKWGQDELIFVFEDEIKSDASTVISELKALKKKVILLSGDRKEVVFKVAQKLKISEFYFEQTPLSKAQFLEKLRSANKKVLMIGDGLNDAPSLALSDVSLSFAKACDLSQNIADIVVNGEKLMPVIDLFSSSKKAIFLMKQNLTIALIYNLLAVPFAIAGLVSPLVAAVAMSSSSLLVVFNSLRNK